MSNTTKTLPPDIEIARRSKSLPIEQIAAKLNIGDDDLEHYGKDKAKISLDLYRRLAGKPTGKLVLVTAITPTPAGEGKTTTSIGLCDGLNRIGKKTTVCLREPSLGPCFGMKGGPPAEATPRLCRWKTSTCTSPAISTPSGWPTTCWRRCSTTTFTTATQLGIDPRRIVWRRVVDMNDRALRTSSWALAA